jgi:adenylate cyclase
MRKISRLARRFGLGRAIGSLLLLLYVLLRLWDPPLLEEIRLRSFDLYQSIKPRVAGDRPIVIVDIDEKSLASLGQWPWPRTILADLITRLTQMGAVGIAFDVLFPEQDRLSPGIAVQSFRQIDEELRRKLSGLPSNDEVFAAAIARSRVVLGQSGVGVTSGQADVRGLPQTGFATMGPDPKLLLVTFPGLLRNLPVLERAAAGRGLVTIRTERDGMVRRVPMVMSAHGQLVPALTLELLRVATGSGAILVKSDAAGVRSVGIRGLEVPTDRNGQVWVHFSPTDPARYVSAKDIIDGSVDPAKVAGKLLLIGTSAVGLLDLKTTPVDAAMPGVEVHAQLLETALTKSVLSYPNYANAIELIFAISVGVAIIVFAPMVTAMTLLIIGAAVGAGLIAVSWFMYVHQGVLLDVTFPLMSSLAIYAALVFVNYFREQIDRRRIRSAFGQYLSPTLVEQLAQSPDKLVLGGEERTMTVMFSDVRGFTAISELYKADPQGLTHLMNRLLTPLTNAILARNGTIDKYMGDAIMAFWNAPLEDAAHETHACEAALDMLDRLHELNEERRREAEAAGQPFIPIRIGIGMNTGQCVVGNMGSDLRFQYSVLGDSVNLASRLEGQTKSYGVPIILGSRTAAAVHGKIATMEIDYITVKGKTEPEVVHTVLGRAETASDGDFERVRDAIATMLRHYRAREWDAALAAAQACRAIQCRFKLDGLADLYAERIQTFKQTPPPPDWDGVFALQTK